MFDSLVAEASGVRGAAAAAAWARVENAASARRLAAMADVLDAYHAASGSAEREQWLIDNFSAVSAELAAAMCVTTGAAANQLNVAIALRERLPRVEATLNRGTISSWMAATIVNRTAAVRDPEALAQLDRTIAHQITTWGPMSVERAAKTVDAIIAQVDPEAVRRTQLKARGRGVEVKYGKGDGMATVFADLFAPDGAALDARLDKLAATVCEHDPRTLDQRRADALGALGHGADRLACLCGRDDCHAAQNPPAGGAVIYLVANHDTLNPPDGDSGPGPGDGPTDPNPTPDDTTANDAHPGEPVVPSASDAESPTEWAPCATESEGDSASDQPADPVASVPAESRPESRAAAAARQEAGLDGDPDAAMPPTRDCAQLGDEPLPDPAAVGPAMILGGAVLPGPIAARAARTAKRVPLIHPGQAPPEPRYRPSTALADFVRARDQTCRAPGCHKPATHCDVDHTIPYPVGPTCASNLKCLCRFHHLLKTFWGWRDEQLPDGTVLWKTPRGRTYRTHPGSRLLFPTLCDPIAPVTLPPGIDRPTPHTTGLTMPRRQRTRKQARKHRITAERAANTEWAEQYRRDHTPPF